jgi:large subunit ribosomal protein L4
MPAKKIITEEKPKAKNTKAKTVKAERAVTVSEPTKEVKASVTEPKKKTTAKLTIDVMDLAGKVVESFALPTEMFGEEVNKKLLAQAVRVYLANKRQGTASTKTRGEVDGSTRKIYRQKGTGRARHGSIRAPIFVKGGIVFGPKPRDFSMTLPQKMRRKALFSALSAKLGDGEVRVLGGLEKIEPKTKLFAQALIKLGFDSKKRKLLLVTAGSVENVKKASRNIAGVSISPAKQLNAYDVLSNKHILFMKEAIDEMKNHFMKESSK